MVVESRKSAEKHFQNKIKRKKEVSSRDQRNIKLIFAMVAFSIGKEKRSKL